MKRKFQRYAMNVLTYYRSEWTDVSDDDKEYRMLVTAELLQLMKTCMRRRVSIPNAAKEVEIFLDLQATKAEIESNPDFMCDHKSTKPRRADDGKNA